MADNEDIFNRFERKAAGADSTMYMSFKKGDFTFGADDEEMDDETQFVVDMTSMMSGWICWVNKEVVDEIHVPVLKGDPPAEADLPDHSAEYVDPAKDGWNSQSSFMMRELGGFKRQFQFKGSSKGVNKAVGNLCKEFLKEGRARNDATLCPVITLQSDSYKHKTYGKIPTPVFQVESWMTKAEAEAHFRSAPPQEEVTAPAETKKLERRPAVKDAAPAAAVDDEIPL